MSFLYPAFLIALASLAVPIIIHFFNFRRYKKILFPNVRFLDQLKQESRSRNKLKHYLLLATRLLILALLVLAFAQPFNEDEAGPVAEGDAAVSIYIDNSYSMNSLSGEGSLLQQANAMVEDIADGYLASDKLMLVQNEVAIGGRFSPKETFLKNVENVNPSPISTPLPAVLLRQDQTFETTEAQREVAYVISDFQRSTALLDEVAFDTTRQYYLVPLQGVQNANISIDSAWFDAPVSQLGEVAELQVRLTNWGEEPVENTTLRLQVDGQQKGLTNLSLGAQESTIATVTWTISEAGWHRAQLEVEDYPVDFDDTYYFTYFVEAQQQVLAIHGTQSSRYLQAVFAQDDLFQYTAATSGNINLQALPEQDLIVLNGLEDVPSGLAQSLRDAVAAGANLLLLPPAPGQGNDVPYQRITQLLDIDQYESFVEQEMPVTELNEDHMFFRNMFEEVPENVNLPIAYGYYTSTARIRTGRSSLLEFASGESFLSEYPLGSGNVFSLATPLDTAYTNFPLHALFVPVMYKVSTFSSQPLNLAYFSGTDAGLQVPMPQQETDEVLVLRGEDLELIPRQQTKGGQVVLNFTDLAPQAGFYELTPQGGGEPVAVVAFNYNREESELAFYSAEELEAVAEANPNVKVLETNDQSVSVQLATLTSPTHLWKWLLALALLFLLIETLIIKLWKA